jgi:CHAD domain-containing protein
VAVRNTLRAESRQKGNIMQKTFKHEDIEQILAEADELIKRVNSNAIKDLEEEHRIQFEKHAQSLKKLRSEVQDKIGKEAPSQSAPYSEGMHEAMDNIVKAMTALANYFS